MVLDDLEPISKAHWQLHLNAAKQDTPSNEAEVNLYLASSIELPSIGHPAWIHDWLEIPAKRDEIEGWEIG